MSQLIPLFAAKKATGLSLSFSSFLAISPELTLLLTAMTLMMIVALHLDRSLTAPVTFGGLGLAWVLTLLAGGTSFPNLQVQSHLLNNAYATFFQALFLGVAAIVCLLGERYFKEREGIQTEFNALVIFSVIGMMVMVASQDFVVLFLGLETMSISGYVMAGYLVSDSRSREAALKYFLTGAVGSAIFLFGIAYIYGATGSLSFVTIGKLSAASIHKTTYFGLGATLLIAGFAFKVGAVPFHMWAPDVYDGAPTPVTAFFSVAVKAAAFAAFAKVVVISLDALPSYYLNMLLGALAAGTMLWGNLAALGQSNIKRMLAYSSIAHAGYLLLAVTVRSVSDMVGPSIMFYFFSYMLMNLGAFSVIIVFENQERGSLDIDDYTGFGYRYPALAVCLSIFLLALAGIPPTIGFVAKWMLFSNAVSTGQSGLILLAIIGVLASLVSVYYYARVIYVMFMREPGRNTVSTSQPFPFEQRIVLALAVAVLLIGVFPQAIVAMASKGKLPAVAQQAAKQWKQALAQKNTPRRPVVRRVVQPAVRPMQPEPRRVEPRKVEPRQVEPRKVEPRQVEPQRREPPQRVEPRKVEPSQRVEPRQVEPRKVEPRRQEPPSTRPATRREPAKVPTQRREPATRPATPRHKVVVRALLPLKAIKIRRKPVRHRHNHHHHAHDGHDHGKPTSRPAPRKRVVAPKTNKAPAARKAPVVRKAPPARTVPKARTVVAPKKSAVRKKPAAAPTTRPAAAPTSRPATR